MKRLLGITLTLASLGMGGLTATANTVDSHSNNLAIAASPSPQWRQRDRNKRGVSNRRHMRTVTQTRVVRVGRRLYRETYVVRHLPNGRTDTRLISRVRIS